METINKQYTVLACSNGSFSIKGEFPNNDFQGAKVKYFNVCAAFENADDVITGSVAIVDEMMNVFPEYKHFVDHRVYEPVESTPSQE